jgi:hypothetical protein
MSSVYQEFDEAIAVEAVFYRGQIRPRRFQWGNQARKVAKITYRWKERKGEATIYFFALLTEDRTALEICFNDKTLEWRLVRCWQEG